MLTNLSVSQSMVFNWKEVRRGYFSLLFDSIEYMHGDMSVVDNILEFMYLL